MENQNTELYLLRLFFNKELFHRYSTYLEKEFIRDNSRELNRLFEALSEFHNRFPDKDVPSVPDFEAFYNACYPAVNAKERGVLDPIFEQLRSLSPDPDVAREIVKAHVEQVKATRIAVMGMEVSEGRRPYEDLVKEMSEGPLDIVPTDEINESEYVTDDIEELFNATIITPGLRWRLRSLNESLGSLRKGDFGFIFKRPETGGTTFLADQCSYFAEQSDAPVLWINNEEEDQRVKKRIFQAALGATPFEIYQDISTYKEIWNELYAKKIRLVGANDMATPRADIERHCRILKPCLIVIDQLDKVPGFSKNDRLDIELKVKYQWARDLAKKYAPVIAVSQAGGSAEGKKYLQMDDVDSSKTGKQGEADWILGIGKSHQSGQESLRYFNLCKNKLMGDADTDPDKRHWSWETILDHKIARYRDI